MSKFSNYGSADITGGPSINGTEDDTSQEVYAPQTAINETLTPIYTKEVEGNTNPFSITFSLVQTSVGAGMLSIPYAFRSMGLVLGIFVTVFVAILSFYTLWLTIKASETVREYDFKSVADKLLGRFAGIPYEIFVFVICYGAATVYLIIIGQLLPDVFKSWLGRNSVLADKYYWTAIMMIPTVILCALPAIGVLSNFAIFSVLSAFYIVLVIIIKFFDVAVKGQLTLAGVNLMPTDVFEAFGAFPILFLSFGCHLTVLTLYKDMKDRTPTKMTISAGVNVFIVLMIYLVLGITGLIIFKGNTFDNVLKNFDPNEIYATIAKFGLTVQLVLSYATLHFACRESIQTIFFKNWTFDWFRWILIEIILIGSMLGIAAMFSEIVTLFSLVGAVAGVFVFYIFPSLLYLRAEKSWPKRIPAILVLIVSAILGIVGTVSVTITTVNKYIKKPIPAMGLHVFGYFE
jgi:amino acid permease